MSTEMTTATKLVRPTFFENLHVQQDLIKKEFVELKKSDIDKRSQEKIQQRKSKDEHMVFNYLWRYFPETMATKNQSPILLHQKIGDIEFKRILKVAKRFYGFRFYASCALMGISFVGIILSSSLNLNFLAAFFGPICLASTIPLVITWGPYLDPGHLSVNETDRRIYLCELYQNKMLEKQ